MKPSATVVLAASAALLFAGITALRTTRDQRTRRFFGEATFQVVEGAERVELYRLKPETILTRGSVVEPFLIQPPITPDGEWTDRLRATLRKPGSYEWGAGKTCIPMPGVAVRFHRKGETVDVLFCFGCRMLSLAPRGKVKWEDFDPAERELVQLMKEALPADKAIQSLR